MNKLEYNRVDKKNLAHQWKPPDAQNQIDPTTNTSKNRTTNKVSSYRSMYLQSEVVDGT